MADDLLTPEPQIPDITEGVLPTEFEQPVQLPSTPEAQIETETAIKEDKSKEERNKLYKDLVEQKVRWGMPKHKAQLETIQQFKQKDDEEKKRVEDENKIELEKLNSMADDYTGAKTAALESGIDFETDPEMEKLLMEREAIVKAQTPADDQYIADKSMEGPSQLEIDQEAEQIKKETARVNAAANIKKEQTNIDKMIHDYSLESMKKEDDENNKIVYDRYWSSRTTGQKIRLGIGLLFSGMGSAVTGQPDQLMGMINKAIDTDIADQKLNRQQALAKKEGAFRKVIDLMDIKLKQSKNDIERGKLTQAKQQVIDQKKSLMKERLGLKFLASGKLKDLTALPQEQRDLAVVMPDGKTYGMALNKESAAKVKETRAKYVPTFDDIDEIISLGSEADIKFNLRKRGLLESRLNALAGALREPFLGPGVMTEKEFTRLKEGTLGDPSKLTKPSSWELEKLQDVKAKIKRKLHTFYRSHGVNVPKDAEQVKVETYRKRLGKASDKYTDAQVLSAMKRLGK